MVMGRVGYRSEAATVGGGRGGNERSWAPIWPGVFAGEAEPGQPLHHMLLGGSRLVRAGVGLGIPLGIRLRSGTAVERSTKCMHTTNGILCWITRCAKNKILTHRHPSAHTKRIGWTFGSGLAAAYWHRWGAIVRAASSGLARHFVRFLLTT